MDKIQLFNRIIEAAEKNTDNLSELLQVAIEQEDEQEVRLLMDKVHQIQKESLLDIQNWNGLIRCDSCGNRVPDTEAKDMGFRVGPDLIEYTVWECWECAGGLCT